VSRQDGHGGFTRLGERPLRIRDMVIRSCTTKTRDLNPSRHLVDFSGARGQIAVVILDYIYSVAQPLRNGIDGDARRYEVTGKASAHIVGRAPTLLKWLSKALPKS